MNCEYVRKYYGVPAAIGRRVIAYGKPGIIAEDMGQYIGVNFDEDKPNRILPCHPTDHVEYLGIGKVRKMTRSQTRYRKYICADSDLTFGEWLRQPGLFGEG